MERVVTTVLQKTGLGMDQCPRLLSDNGSSYVSGDLKKFLDEESIIHVRGKPLNPQTQGKIERYHESLNKVTPADVYFGREQEILENRRMDFILYKFGHTPKFSHSQN